MGRSPFPLTLLVPLGFGLFVTIGFSLLWRFSLGMCVLGIVCALLVADFAQAWSKRR